MWVGICEGQDEGPRLDPKLEPEPLGGGLGGCDDSRRRCQKRNANVSADPASRPGKSPAATAAPGDVCGQVVVVDAFCCAGTVGRGTGVSVMLAGTVVCIIGAVDEETRSAIVAGTENGVLIGPDGVDVVGESIQPPVTHA